MLGRLFWFVLGAAGGGWAATRGRERAREAVRQSPRTIGRQVGRRLSDAKATWWERILNFVDAVQEGAAERELERHRSLQAPPDHPSTRP